MKEPRTARASTEELLENHCWQKKDNLNSQFAPQKRGISSGTAQIVEGVRPDTYGTGHETSAMVCQLKPPQVLQQVSPRF